MFSITLFERHSFCLSRDVPLGIASLNIIVGFIICNIFSSRYVVWCESFSPSKRTLFILCLKLKHFIGHSVFHSIYIVLLVLAVGGYLLVFFINLFFYDNYHKSSLEIHAKPNDEKTNEVL
jgi:hypothetical protein